MSLPLLQVTPTTQNQRVEGYEVPNEDTSPIYRLTANSSDTDLDAIIWAGYRQIFSEHLILEKYRQPNLESQLRNRGITVRDFVRGLGKSEVYRGLVGDTNSNYRLVDISFKRFLGRATYNKDEQISWSIVIATRGLHGFIDALVDSDEYRSNFGDEIIPYQRRRFNERPFNLVNPRYADYWRDSESIRSLEGRSFYQATVSGQAVQRGVRNAIPANFLAMARGLTSAGGMNYQRSADRARNQVASMQISDMSREGKPQPTVRRTEVALPYRYIPSQRTT